MNAPPVQPAPARSDQRNAVTLKLLFIAGLVLVLLVPLHLVNSLRKERSERRTVVSGVVVAAAADLVFEGYRMVERALKHGALVLALVFAAFFLFETLAAVMFFTREVDWDAHDAGPANNPEAAQ